MIPIVHVCCRVAARRAGGGGGLPLQSTLFHTVEGTMWPPPTVHTVEGSTHTVRSASGRSAVSLSSLRYRATQDQPVGGAAHTAHMYVLPCRQRVAAKVPITYRLKPRESCLYCVGAWRGEGAMKIDCPLTPHMHPIASLPPFYLGSASLLVRTIRAPRQPA